jgi:hypothetical protein
MPGLVRIGHIRPDYARLCQVITGYARLFNDWPRQLRFVRLGQVRSG